MKGSEASVRVKRERAEKVILTPGESSMRTALTSPFPTSSYLSYLLLSFLIYLALPCLALPDLDMNGQDISRTLYISR